MYYYVLRNEWHHTDLVHDRVVILMLPLLSPIQQVDNEQPSHTHTHTHTTHTHTTHKKLLTMSSEGGRGGGPGCQGYSDQMLSSVYNIQPFLV